MTTVITYLPANVSLTRGDYLAINWPLPLQHRLLITYDSLPDILIEPRKGHRRLVTLLDLLDLLFLWRSGMDLTDCICTFLWEYRAEDDGDFEERVLAVEDIIVQLADDVECFIQELPKRKFVTLPFLNEQLLVVVV